MRRSEGDSCSAEFDELDGIVERTGTKDEAAGFKRDVAKSHLRTDAHGVQVGMGRLPDGERIVVAVNDDQGANAQDRIHGEGLRGVDADGDESDPAAAADGAARGKGSRASRRAGECCQQRTFSEMVGAVMATVCETIGTMSMVSRGFPSGEGKSEWRAAGPQR